MKTVTAFVFGLLFLGSTAARAEFATIILPAPVSTNFTYTISSNDVMEILSTAIGSSIVIVVTTQGNSVSFGQGNLIIPYPFVIAGPATVEFTKTSTGGDGGMITYRTSPKQPMGAGSR